jgi:PAS domain S-box-containing protein
MAAAKSSPNPFSAQMLQAALQTAAAIIIIDDQGIVRSVNPSFQNVGGVAR